MSLFNHEGTNQEQQESSTYDLLQISQTTKCHISATETNLFNFLLFLLNQGEVGRDVLTSSMRSSFHHLGARTENSRDTVEWLARSEGAASRLADAERVDGLGCKVGSCPGCILDPIRLQHSIRKY